MRVSNSMWLCFDGISVSASPWINRTGHFTYFIISRLLKCSDINIDKNFPATFTATSLTVVYGLISTSPLGLNIFASILDGPLPIDLPNNITSSRANPSPPSFLGFMTWLNKLMAHFFISFAFGENFLSFCIVSFIIWWRKYKLLKRSSALPWK